MYSSKKLIGLLIILCIFNLPFADAAAGDCGNAGQMPTGKACCCAASGSTVVKLTGVKTCASITCGSAVVSALATDCSTDYGFASGLCTACTAPAVNPDGATGACQNCPTGTATCTAGGTTASTTFTALTCSAGYLKPATGACTACPAGQGSSAANTASTCVACGTNAATCDVTAGSSGANGAVSQVTACNVGFALKDPASGTLKTCEAFPATAIAGCTKGTMTSAGAFTCTECGADGYATGAPTGATPACAACTATANCGACGATAAGTCTACKAGFYNTAASGAALACSACAEGCATCPAGADGATKCSTVKKGWKLSAATAPATPVKCGGDGKTSTAATSAACDVACPANCATCNTDSTKCDVCNANFEVDAAGACVAIAEADRHATCATASKKASADHCLSCKEAQNREQPEDAASTTTPKAKLTKCVCKAGFGDKSGLKTPDFVCAACPENSTACTFDDAGVKTVTCKTGFYAAGTACLAQDAANVTGFFFDATSSTFKTCHATCLTCTTGANNGCTKCKEAPATWVEPKSDAANYATYIKGTRWLNASMCYDDCPTGFVANEARNGCEAASFSTGLFSLIFVIFSIFITL